LNKFETLTPASPREGEDDRAERKEFAAELSLFRTSSTSVWENKRRFLGKKERKERRRKCFDERLDSWIRRVLQSSGIGMAINPIRGN
jgi:hypothetical protein